MFLTLHFNTSCRVVFCGYFCVFLTMFFDSAALHSNALEFGPNFVHFLTMFFDSAEVCAGVCHLPPRFRALFTHVFDYVFVHPRMG
jgi:hypothetical protein